jgi:uncharacterized protein (DUF885 family)
MTQTIKDEMLRLGKVYFNCQNFEQVASLLTDRTSNTTFLQSMTIEKVESYLKTEYQSIKSSLSNEFTTFPHVDFNFQFFKSVGVAYYIPGLVNTRLPPTHPNYCIQQGTYQVGVPSLNPNEYFAYEKDDLSLLIHEGSPGHHHLYQTALESHKIHECMGQGLQLYLSSLQSGFVEGWALYAESLGFSCGLYDELENPLRVLRHYSIIC